MAFIKKNIGEEKAFGPDLRELRELRGWSLDQLSQQTHISKQIIAALEEEDLEALGNLRHAERYVEKIVSALAGRPGFILGKFRKAAAEKIAIAQNIKFIQRVKKWDLFVPSKYFALLALLPLVLLLGYYVYDHAASLSSAPLLEISFPPEYVDVTEPRLTVRGYTDPAAAVTINDEKAIVESDGYFSLDLDLARGFSTVTIKSIKRRGGSSEVIRYVTYAPPLGP